MQGKDVRDYPGAMDIAQHANIPAIFEIAGIFIFYVTHARKNTDLRMQHSPYMEMLPENVLILENNIGLVAVAHLLHVFLRNFTESFIGQPVLR